MVKNGKKKMADYQWTIFCISVSQITLSHLLLMLLIIQTLTTSVVILVGCLACSLTLLYFSFHGAEGFPKVIQDQVILFINSLWLSLEENVENLCSRGYMVFLQFFLNAGKQRGLSASV